MQPKQQRALELILAGHSVTDIASQVGVRRETVWRWRNDPSFASQVSVRQAQRRQSIHDELDAGVIESVRMLRGLVADTDAPPGARVRAATALMDRAGLTPAYAVEVRHKAEHAQQQATEQAFKDPQDLARDILAVLPTAVAILPRDEVEAVLSDLPRMTVDSPTRRAHAARTHFVVDDSFGCWLWCRGKSGLRFGQLRTLQKQ